MIFLQFFYNFVSNINTSLKKVSLEYIYTNFYRLFPFMIFYDFFMIFYDFVSIYMNFYRLFPFMIFYDFFMILLPTSILV